MSTKTTEGQTNISYVWKNEKVKTINPIGIQVCQAYKQDENVLLKVGPEFVSNLKWAKVPQNQRECLNTPEIYMKIFFFFIVL